MDDLRDWWSGRVSRWDCHSHSGSGKGKRRKGRSRDLNMLHFCLEVRKRGHDLGNAGGFLNLTESNKWISFLKLLEEV